MRNLLLSLVYLSILTLINAQTPKYSWAKSWGSLLNDKGPAIATDALGNIYVTGQFDNIVDFDPSVGVSILVSDAVGIDAYISKFDSSGNFLWVKHLTSDGLFLTNDLIFDDRGYLYLTGSFDGEVDLDPGPGNYNLTALHNDAFILKLDLEGNFIWAVSTQGRASSYAISLDNDGNIVIVGDFKGHTDFDPGPGEVSFDVSGVYDGFVAKYNSDGQFIWAKQIAGDKHGEARCIVTDHSGNVYVAGPFNDRRDFDPGLGTFILESADSFFDGYVLKLNSDGNFQWVRHLTSDNIVWSTEMAIDDLANVHVAGYFNDTIDFDPGPAIFQLIPISTDPFVWKLDSNGELLWASHFTGKDYQETRSVYLDAKGGVYSIGWYSDTCDFDPGPGVFLLTPDAGTLIDIFISKLNANGEFVWAYSPGGSGRNYGGEIDIDLFGNIVFTGIFEGTTNLSLGKEVNDSVVSVGLLDIFLAKWNQCVLNSNVRVGHNNLVAEQLNVAYQWLDCENGMIPISGQTDQTFQPFTSGNYAVEVATGSCIDTSTCFSFIMTTSNNPYQEDPIVIYPNPSTEFFILDLGHLALEVSIQIIDFSGKVLYGKTFFNEQKLSIHFNRPPGLYFLIVVTENGRAVKKLLIE